ncbi:MAG: hypothetical protein RIC87_12500 [Kiloniellales bacterium]
MTYQKTERCPFDGPTLVMNDEEMQERFGDLLTDAPQPIGPERDEWIGQVEQSQREALEHLRRCARVRSSTEPLPSGLPEIVTVYSAGQTHDGHGYTLSLDTAKEWSQPSQCGVFRATVPRLAIISYCNDRGTHEVFCYEPAVRHGDYPDCMVSDEEPCANAEFLSTQKPV